LSLAAILVGSLDHRTQFWKGAIQESFQQSLVEIGSVVSEEKIFFKFHSKTVLLQGKARYNEELSQCHFYKSSVIQTSNQDGRQTQNRKKRG
jgi:hypothetical protein